MKRMQKIAVAQQKADHFCAPLENPAGLRIGAKSQAPDRIKHLRASFPANLRAGVQHPRNRPNAHACSARYLANGRFFWNCFHRSWGSLRLCASPSVCGARPSIFVTYASLAHISATAVNSVTRGPAGAPEQEVTKSFLHSGFADSDLTDAFRSDRVWNQFQRPPRRSGVSSKTTWGV